MTTRDMNGQTCENGVYQSRAWHGKFHAHRDVYIQNGSVMLANDPDRMRFAYDFFFQVNVLGPKLRDIPEGMNIRSI